MLGCSVLKSEGRTLPVGKFPQPRHEASAAKKQRTMPRNHLSQRNHAEHGSRGYRSYDTCHPKPRHTSQPQIQLRGHPLTNQGSRRSGTPQPIRSTIRREPPAIISNGPAEQNMPEPQTSAQGRTLGHVTLSQPYVNRWWQCPKDKRRLPQHSHRGSG